MCQECFEIKYETFFIVNGQKLNSNINHVHSYSSSFLSIIYVFVHQFQFKMHSNKCVEYKKFGTKSSSVLFAI